MILKRFIENHFPRNVPKNDNTCILKKILYSALKPRWVLKSFFVFVLEGLHFRGKEIHRY